MKLNAFVDQWGMNWAKVKRPILKSFDLMTACMVDALAYDTWEFSSFLERIVQYCYTSM